MKQQPRLFVGGLTGRVFVATRWHTEGDVFVADEKHDVTDQFVALAADFCDDYVTSKVVNPDISDDARTEVRP